MKKWILGISIFMNVIFILLFGWNWMNSPSNELGRLEKDLEIGYFQSDNAVFRIPKGLTVKNVSERGLGAIGQFENERFSIVITSEDSSLVNYDLPKDSLDMFGNFYSAEIPQNKSENETSQVNKEFQNFIEQFPEVQLPLSIKTCESKYYNKLTKVNDPEGLLKRPEQNFVLGKVKTDGTYIAIITLEEAECYIPVLTTFKLNGEKINSKVLMIGLCGSDACFECKEVIEIDNKLNINLSHNSYYFECDENMIDRNKVTNKTNISINGVVNQNGIIRLNQK